MKEIDIENWERKNHYLFFSNMDYPHYNLCFDVEITDFLSSLKQRNMPFYYAMIYAATRSANAVEAFRYRIRDNKIVLHDELFPSFTYLKKGEELFKMVTLAMEDDLEKFVNNAQTKSMEQREYFIQSDFVGKDHYIFITSIPWISFTHISHTIRLNKNDSVPRISWGKYYNNDGKVLLPFSVQVNHCFADGIHISQYQEALYKEMEKICHPDAG